MEELKDDLVLRFYNQAHRTDHPNWDFDTTGYLQRSTTDLFNSILRTMHDGEDGSED